MAVKPDIDTFVAPNKPFVVRLQSDSSNEVVKATLTLQVEGQTRKFSVGDHKTPTSGSAESHTVEVDPFFGSKVFFHEWGEASQGNDIVVFAASGGVTHQDEGDVF